jgi:hypothetical protein
MSEKPASLPPPLKPDSWRCYRCLMTFRVAPPPVSNRYGEAEPGFCECGKRFWQMTDGNSVPKNLTIVGMWPHPYSEFLEEIQ